MAQRSGTRPGFDAVSSSYDRSLSADQALGDLLTSFLQLTASSLSARWCALFLFSTQERVLTLAALWDCGKAVSAALRRTVAAGRIRRVAETGEPEVGTGRLGEWLGSRRLAPGEQYPGAAVLVESEGRKLGVVSIIRDTPLPFRPEEVELALLAGRHLGLCLRTDELYQQARESANSDELTGLHNYRHFNQRLEAEIERAQRYQRPMSLLMLDLDDFKEYNDLFGHPQGNAALCHLAGTIKEVVRRVDIAARYGGDEFAVLLPETDASQALRVASRLRDAVEASAALPAPSGLITRPLSISVGISSFPAPARDRDELLRQADEALYHAKKDASGSIQAWRSREPDDPELPSR